MLVGICLITKRLYLGSGSFERLSVEIAGSNPARSIYVFFGVFLATRRLNHVEQGTAQTTSGTAAARS